MELLEIELEFCVINSRLQRIARFELKLGIAENNVRIIKCQL